jgi:hypothetical protein
MMWLWWVAATPLRGGQRCRARQRPDALVTLRFDTIGVICNPAIGGLGGPPGSQIDHGWVDGAGR